MELEPPNAVNKAVPRERYLFWYGRQEEGRQDGQEEREEGKSVAPERFFAIHGTPGGWQDRIDSETLVL